MTGYVKQGGSYKPMDSAFVKVNGIYQPFETAYVKVNGVYEVWYSNTGGGSNPQDDLDSIILLNDTVSNSVVNDESENDIWGNGVDKDSNTNIIAGGNIFTTYDRSYCIKMPLFVPQLNHDEVWLASKGITISGSTASISRKEIIKNLGSFLGFPESSNKSDSPSYDVITQDVYDNLNTTLSNNSILLQSKERQTYGGSFDLSSNIANFGNSAVNLLRQEPNFGGIKIAHTNSFDNLAARGCIHWRIEVDVNYNITFFHADSGLSRTINKTVKFRTYN